jgi:hypothetical protein
MSVNDRGGRTATGLGAAKMTTIPINGGLGHVIDNIGRLLSTINKILIDDLSIWSFCCQATVDKTSFLSTNC